MDYLSFLASVYQEKQKTLTLKCVMHALVQRLGGGTMKKPLRLSQKELDAAKSYLISGGGLLTRSGKCDDGMEICYPMPGTDDDIVERWQNANDESVKQAKTKRVRKSK